MVAKKFFAVSLLTILFAVANCVAPVGWRINEARRASSLANPGSLTVVVKKIDPSRDFDKVLYDRAIRILGQHNIPATNTTGGSSIRLEIDYQLTILCAEYQGIREPRYPGDSRLVTTRLCTGADFNGEVRLSVAGRTSYVENFAFHQNPSPSIETLPETLGAEYTWPAGAATEVVGRIIRNIASEIEKYSSRR
jgi:hypothetical protein